MKRIPVFLAWLFLFCFSSFTQASRAEAQTLPVVIINEVQIAGDKADDEFIELSNTTDKAIDLNGWKLRKKTKNDTSATGSSIIDLSMADTLLVQIPAKGSLLWANSKGIFKTLTLTTLSTGNSFTNDTSDPYSIALFDTNNTLIDAVTWGLGHTSPFAPSIIFPTNPPKNTSLERDIATNAFFSQIHPTPHNDASILEKPLPAPISTPAPTDQTATTPFVAASLHETAIRINEILPDPSDTEEFIELFNAGTTDINLKDWSLHDASKTGGYIFKEGALIKAQAYLTILRSTFSFALNNTHETVTLLNPDHETVDTVSYVTSKPDTSYNFSPSGWRWSDLITPDAPNQFEAAPVSKTSVPKHIYKQIPAHFEAKTPSADTTPHYTWNFGDKHKSHVASVAHTYTKTGTYTITLTTATSLDETVQTFTRKVTKPPKMNLAITGINPNPAGSDTGHEWITLKNMSKHSVDLANWSIASGTTQKTLTNHPIKESVVIKPMKSVTLTNEHAAFSLPNTSGFVELRLPHQKAIDTLQYTKADGIQEDESYQQTAALTWAWTSPDTQTPKETLPIAQENAVVTDTPLQAAHTETHSIATTNDVIPLIDTLSADELIVLQKQVEERLHLAAIPQTAANDKVVTAINAEATDTAQTIDPSILHELPYHEQSSLDNVADRFGVRVNRAIPLQKIMVEATESSSLLATTPLEIPQEVTSHTSLLQRLNQTLGSFTRGQTNMTKE